MKQTIFRDLPFVVAGVLGLGLAAWQASGPASPKAPVAAAHDVQLARDVH